MISKKQKAGLILAKLAPMHIGHEYVIDTALKITPDLTIVTYDCPDRTHIPLNTRSNWVRRLYPDVNVIEGWDAPNEHEDTPEIRKKQEDYVGGVLHGKKITHFFSSEFYGEHMSKYLDAENYIIDMKRKKINISSTMIRNNPYKYRKFLNPVVLEDVITKILILGVPSEHTENIVKNVSKELSTTYVGNEFLKIVKNNLSVDVIHNTDLYNFSKRRIKKSSCPDILYKSNRSLIFSSASLVDHVINVGINRIYNSKLFEMAKDEISRYDLLLVVKNNDVNVKSGIEYFDNNFFFNQLCNNIKDLRVKYHKIMGSQSKLVSACMEKIEKYNIIRKY